MYYILSFRSRSHSICFFEKASARRLAVKLVSTPRAVQLGCGLSVKIPCAEIECAKTMLDFTMFSSFLGLFCFDGMEYVREM